MEFLLLAATAGYPHIYANEYCWALYRGSTHEEAVVKAIDLSGTTDDQHVPTFCKDIIGPEFQYEPA